MQSLQRAASLGDSVSFHGKQRLKEVILSPPACSDYAVTLIFLCRVCTAERFSESRCLLAQHCGSLLKTDLCPTIDLNNKAKQQPAAFLINSANNGGSLGRGCSPGV